MDGKGIKWTTPLSGVEDLGFVSLVCNLDALIITFRDERADTNIHYRLTWTNFCAYKCTVEEQWTPFGLDSLEPFEPRNTIIVEDSEWIAALKDGNDLMDVHEPNAKHYVILNSSFWTEVISTKEPLIEVFEDS